MVIRRALLIVNPAARRGVRDVAAVVSQIRKAGVACDTRFTTAPGSAAQLARELGPSCDAVFVLGGDGTSMEALSALTGTQIPVAPLPGGTGNLLTGALGIPRHPVRAAAELCAGHIRTLDLGRLAGGGCFAVAAGIGIDVSMVARTSAALKRYLGTGAYVLTGSSAAIGSVWRGERFEVRLTVDGVLHELETFSVLVANVGALFGGALTLAPGATPDDGWLDVVVYTPRTLRQAVRVASRMLRGRFVEDGLTRFFRGRHIQVSTNPTRPAQADGELLPPGDLDVSVAQGAARLLVPGAL